MNMYDVILKKRNGEELSTNEINYVVEGYVKGEIPDYQMSAFLMAVYFQKMIGKLIDNNGNSIISDFKDDISYGKNKEIHYSNGDYYKGDILNGLKEGKGKLTFKNDSYYEGGFENDTFNGKGKGKFNIVMVIIMKVIS